MKNKINFKTVAIIATFMLVMSQKGSSQVYTLTNSLSCAVVVNWETWAQTCPNCAFGTATISANSSIQVTACNPDWGLCIVVMDIGGTTPAVNHCSNSQSHCHNGAQNTQSGSGIPTPSCNSSGNWSCQIVGTTWTIQ